MGHGKGSGEGECGCCQPCGVCGIALKLMAFIWAIVHIVWGGLWVLFVLLDLRWFARYGTSAENWVFWVLYLLLAGCWLALGIILMFGVRCTTDMCKIHFYLAGCIGVLAAALILGIVWEIVLESSRHSLAGYGYGAGNAVWLVVVTCLWWWYPYWCIYAYYIELGGKSWCKCEGCQ